MAGRITIEAANAVKPKVRSEPPASLSAEEAALWRLICAEKPIEWFTQDVHVLLTEYCRASVKADWLYRHIRVAQLRVNAMLPEDDDFAAVISALDKFMKWQDINAKHVISYATKLRLTPQARTDASSAFRDSAKAHLAAESKPWEDEGFLNTVVM